MRIPQLIEKPHPYCFYIYGFNISLLAGLFTLLFSRLLGRWRGAALAALGIAFYTVLVGAGASVVRAALMGWLGLLAMQIGRRQNGLNSLAIVAAVMAAFTPGILWDVGFQLSFLATLGLVLYADPIQGVFERMASRFLPAQLVERLAKPVGEYLLLKLLWSGTDSSRSYPINQRCAKFKLTVSINSRSDLIPSKNAIS